MTRPELPWHSSHGETDLPRSSLGQRFVGLSELTVAPASWHLFSPAQTLAVMHSHGMLHGDLHREHMFFDPDSGHSLVIDVASTRRNEELDPLECATDFVPPYMSLDADDFHAFLSGYVNVAQTYVDVLRSRFTEELLSALQIEIENYTAPRQHAVDASGVLHAVSLSLSIRSGVLVLAETSRSTRSHELPKIPEVLHTICGLMLSGIDCSEAVRRITSTQGWAERKEAAATLAFLSESGSYGTTAEVAANGPLAARVLARMGQVTRNGGSGRKASPPLQPDPLALGVLKQFLGECPREQISRFVDDMIDVTDFLAQECLALEPRHEAQRISMALAQYSQMLLLSIVGDAEQDEERLATMLRRSYSLDWMTSFLASEEANEVTLQELAYANSRSSVLLRAFQSSLVDVETNPRWSTVWRCLTLTQQCILVLKRLLSDPSFVESHHVVLAQIAPVLTNKFGAVLTAYAQALMMTGKFQVALKSWAGDDGRMMKLLEVTRRLVDVLKDHEVVSPQGRAALDDVLTNMKIDRPFAFAHLIKR